MNNGREPIGKRLRFEIFARDGFSCRYCGRKSDLVQLEVDHVTPVCEGGTNIPENLVTSCFDCNRGKGKKPIDAHELPDVDRLRLLQEQREQLQALGLAKETAAAREDLRQEICNFFCDKAGVKEMSVKTLNILSRFAKEHSIEKVFEWIEMAVERVDNFGPQRDDKVGMYVCGIRRRLLERGEL